MKFKPIADGSLMTLKQFISCVNDGSFIDFDGFGYYAYKDKMSDKIIRPSHITGRAREISFKTGKLKKIKVKKRIDKNFTHVVWFNR